MDLSDREIADVGEQLVQVHGEGIGRRLVGNLLEIVQCTFLEGVDRGLVSVGFLLQFRQSADQNLLCLNA